MNNRISSIRNLIKRYGFYIPFTFYLALFLAGTWLVYHWLRTKADVPDSAFKDIFTLLIRFAVWFCVVILCLGLVSVLVSYVYFLWKKKKTGITFSINTPQGNNKTEQRQTIKINIHPVLRPLLGFVKIRLKYDNTRYSEKFLLVKQSRKKLFDTTIDGIYYWDLPEIKEYRVEQAIIYFEDFFQFFSLAIGIDTSNNFHTPPMDEAAEIQKAFPRMTEETTTRIEEIKRVEGEYLSYKNFESNDDVRRIVWKIYAKNKELVVRIPEILDPYASHIYLYASFHSFYNITGNEVVEIPFLNYYKTLVWSVYKQLAQKGFEVRYIPDQDIPKNKMPYESEQIKYSISVSQWHTDNELKEYVKTKDASVVIIASLTNIDDVNELVERFGNEIAFIFVPLTDSLNKQHFGDWLQWLFVQQEKDAIAKYKTNWSLSLLRIKIAQNEKQIKQLLEKYDKSTVMQKAL